MLKFLSFCFLIIFLSACGVETSSSPMEGKNGSGYPTDPGSDVTDPDDGNGTIDPDDGNGTVDPDDGNGGTDVDSTFDTVDAVYDANACNANYYNIAMDASYDGVNRGENGSGFADVSGQGLGIRSEHLEGSSANLGKTWVTLFYKSFPDSKHLDVQGFTSHYMEGVFFLTYDIAWSDESINDIDNTVYVQSQKTTKPSCYRLVLNNIIGTNIDVQKVYR